MKKFTRISLFAMVLVVFVLSACGAAAPAAESAASGGKVQASLVEFTGVIEAINGNQWTINGQVITVDPSVIKDGPFQVGDTVKLEADVAQDGTVTVTRVELPSAASTDANGNESAANDNSSTNSNSNTNANSNESVPPTDGSLVFDDSGNEAFGSVESITTDSVVIGGQTFALTNSTEFKGLIEAGAFVKVHLALNADGTYTVTEIEIWDPTAVSSNDNSNSNSNLNSNGDDDNGNDDNGNDDNSNDDDDDDNSNGNSNDDDDDDDDNSNGGNSNGNGNG